MQIPSRLVGLVSGGIAFAGLAWSVVGPHFGPQGLPIGRPRGEVSIPPERPAVPDDGSAIWATGRIEAVRQAVVASKVTGRVEAFVKKEGDAVQAGDIIAVLERSEQSAKLREAKLRRNQAKSDLARNRRLRRTDAISARELEQYQTAHEVARAEVASLLAAVEDRIVRAPFSGRVLKTFVEAGESVAPGAPVFALGDVSELKVRAEVDELDLGRLAEGARAAVHPDALPGEAYEGKVARLSGMLGRKAQFSDDPRERSDAKVLEAEVGLPAAPRLVPGMTVKVEIEARSPSRTRRE